MRDQELAGVPGQKQRISNILPALKQNRAGKGIVRERITSELYQALRYEQQ
jgi:hypothetical protein